MYSIEEGLTEIFDEVFVCRLDTHSGKPAVYVDARACNETARVPATKQNGSANEFVGVAKAIHGCLAHDLRNSFWRKDFPVLFSWKKAGAQNVYSDVFRSKFSRHILRVIYDSSF